MNKWLILAAVAVIILVFGKSIIKGFQRKDEEKSKGGGGGYISSTSTVPNVSSSSSTGIPIKEIITKPVIKVTGTSKFEEPDGPVYGNMSPNVMYRYMQKVSR